MRRILIIIALFIILSPCISAIERTSIQNCANFYSDYTELFNMPPKYLVCGGSQYNIAEAYGLFAQYAADKDKELLPIKPKPINNNFITTKECNKSIQDIKSAAGKLAEFISKNKQLPLAIKIDDCYISNADFLHLLTRIIRDEYENNLQEDYQIKKTYFNSIIKWNSEKDEKYIEFSMDYESDRPVFSGNYINSQPIIKENVPSIGINPLFLKKFCYKEFCNIPDDFNEKIYSSKEVAWYTAVMNNDEIYYPSCYPYCGVILGTEMLSKEFIKKYSFPLTLHMTGDSIIAAASKPQILKEIKELKEKNLLSLGLHTMYHTNIEESSKEFSKESIKKNYEIFRYVFNDSPIQFRAPYLALPKNYSSDEFLSGYAKADNEVPEACSLCNSPESCNYEFCPNLNFTFVKVDWNIVPGDNLLNSYFAHPWELIYETEGSPVYLKESEKAKTALFKKWIFLFGEFGYIPVNPERYLE